MNNSTNLQINRLQKLVNQATRNLPIPSIILDAAFAVAEKHAIENDVEITKRILQALLQQQLSESELTVIRERLTALS